ncbi:MAG: flagellar biosynthesis protein FlhB [Nitrospirae bacterium]|nr:MAG: flagellar biosynthesis protein FlhB [Nitrospirota bacterium]
MAEDQEKTQKATPRRRQKAREEGQVARSRELSGMLAFGGAVLSFLLLGHYSIQRLLKVLYEGFSFTKGTDLFNRLNSLSIEGMLALMPVLLFTLVMGVAGSLIQGGFVYKPFKINPSSLNPVEGIKRLFSPNAALDFLKGLVKFVAGGLILYLIIKKILPVVVTLFFLDVRQMSLTMKDLLLYTLKVSFIAFFMISFLDYVNEKWRFERSLRMSREEIKEEFKETEGDPQVKSRIRSIQREMARKRMMQEVPKATVVITNPTHIAVALKYERGQKGAPTVVAKGAGFVAEKIKEIAQRYDVPIVEDKPLARALFKLELGSEIPESLYRAVARILAYIYKLKGVGL